MASNRAIGLDGQMPWHLPADLKHFRQTTMGAPLIMGRKTFEAIGRPLPGRRNLIISRDYDYRQSGCEVFNSIAAALEACKVTDEVFIIGGATLYHALLPSANYLYLTEINKDFPADTYFPPFDRNNWLELSREDFQPDTEANFSYSFIKLEQLRPLPFNC